MIIRQRYAKYLWSVIDGKAPLIVTGPNFKSVAKADAGRRPYWRMLPAFVTELRTAAENHLADDRRADQLWSISELLFEEGIVQGLWLNEKIEDPNFDYDAFHRGRGGYLWCIGKLVSEVPLAYHNVDDAVGDVLELLDGLSSKEYYTGFFNQHDAVSFRVQPVVI